MTETKTKTMSSTVHQLRKEGKLKEAWQLAVTMNKNHTGDRRYELELAWVYYDFLKREAENGNSNNFLRVCQKLQEITIEENDTLLREQFTWIFIKMINKILNKNPSAIDTIFNITDMYMKIIGLNNPSLPQSVFLKTLLKTKTQEGLFWQLIPWLNKKILRDEDYKPELFGNNKIMPLAERIFYNYAKSLISDAKTGSQKAIKALVDFVNSSNDNNIQSYTFADYYLAEANHQIGNHDKAIKLAENFVRKNHQKSWAWALLANVTADNNKKLSYLSLAISIERNETFLLRIRESIIPLLLTKGFQLAATQNIKIILNTRHKNNWAIPDRIKKHINESWFENPTDNNDIKTILKEESEKAMENLFKGIKKTTAIVTRKQDKNTALFTINGDEIKIKTRQRLLPGDWLELYIHKKKIISHKKISQPENLKKHIRSYKGIIRKQSNFGFVDNIFISPFLIEKQNINNNEMCQGYAIFTTDYKKNRKGWKAISATITKK